MRRISREDEQVFCVVTGGTRVPGYPVRHSYIRDMIIPRSINHTVPWNRARTRVRTRARRMYGTVASLHLHIYIHTAVYYLTSFYKTSRQQQQQLKHKTRNEATSNMQPQTIIIKIKQQQLIKYQSSIKYVQLDREDTSLSMVWSARYSIRGGHSFIKGYTVQYLPNLQFRSINTKQLHSGFSRVYN